MEMIVSHEHKCCDCEYGMWAPKQWPTCYICQNKDCYWYNKPINGFELLTCKEFEKRKD